MAPASGFERSKWRDLCKAQRSNVWSLIYQLLHFAATEHPDEFLRHRDTLAEVLFSPVLSGRRSDASEDPFARESDAQGRGEDDEEEEEADVTLLGSSTGSRPSPRTQFGSDPARARDAFLLASRHGGGASERVVKETAAQGHGSRAPADRVRADRVNADPGSAEPRTGRIGRQHGVGLTRHHVVTDVAPDRTVGQSDASEPQYQDQDGSNVAREEDDGCHAYNEEDTCLAIEEVNAAISDESTPQEELLALLKQLEHLPMSIQLLKKTQVGKVMRVLTKPPHCSSVQSAARQLVREWKALVEKSVHQKEPAEQGVAEEDRGRGRAQEEVEEEREGAGPAPCQGGDEAVPAGSLSVPPWDEIGADVDMTNLDVSTCLTDLESMESELSNSVGSGGGPTLATKTPESHRASNNSDSSPCETNRTTSAGPSAATANHRPQSVLSQHVKASGWADSDAVPAEGKSREQGRQLAPCSNQGEKEEGHREDREVQQTDDWPQRAEGPQMRKPGGGAAAGTAVSYQQRQRTPASGTHEVWEKQWAGDKEFAREKTPPMQCPPGGADKGAKASPMGGGGMRYPSGGGARTAEKNPLPNPLPGQPRAAQLPANRNAGTHRTPPRPEPVASARASEADRQLEAAKRKLQEQYHRHDEAKKSRVIQVVDAMPSKAKSKGHDHSRKGGFSNVLRR